MFVSCIFPRPPHAGIALLLLVSGCGSSETETTASSAGTKSADSVQATTDELVMNNAPKRSEAEIVALFDGEPQAIRKATDLAGLQQVLGEDLSLRVVLDMKSLANVDITREQAIDIPDDAETLGEALDATLLEISAGYYLDDGALVITSRAKAENHMLTRRYDLSGTDGDYLENLRTTLPDHVVGANWAMIDGEGGAYAVDPSTSSLFVTQSFRIQEKIRQLLSEKLGEPVPFKPAKPEDFPDQPAPTFGSAE